MIHSLVFFPVSRFQIVLNLSQVIKPRVRPPADGMRCPECHHTAQHHP